MKKLLPILILTILIISSTSAQAGKGRVNVAVSPAPPALSMSIGFEEPSGNNMLDAAETGKLVVTVKNSGRGDAFDCQVQIVAAKQIRGLRFNREVSFGTIPAGETRVMEIPLTADEEIPTDTAALTIALKEANGFDPAPVKLAFDTKAFAEPKLIVADMGINDQSHNGRIEPMEMVELTVRV